MTAPVNALTQQAFIAALEAEVAQLRSGIHPPENPMPGGFSLESFMPGLKPEDADAFCAALDAASPDLSEKQGTFSDKIAALEAQLGDADNRIEELQALLREWSSGARVKVLEAQLAEERRVRGMCVEAMRAIRHTQSEYAFFDAAKKVDAALAAAAKLEEK